MKKTISLLVMVVLLASFAFVGGVSADENAPHVCLYSGIVAFPGEIITITITDASGNTVYTNSVDNSGGSGYLFSDDYLAYVPAVSGTITIFYTGPYGTGSYSFPSNFGVNGECFDDGRLNSRPDRDNAAPVAIYIRFAEDGDGYDGYEVYDIDQTAGTGLPAFHVTDAELSAAYDEALSTGANVTIEQQNDILFTMLGGSTEDEGICQVNALDQEGKIYEYQWVCW